MSLPQGINLDEPRYPQNTYINRAKHFLIVTNPLNVFASEKELEKAARIYRDYKAGKPVPEVKTEDELWRAKYLYVSFYSRILLDLFLYCKI